MSDWKKAAYDCGAMKFTIEELEQIIGCLEQGAMEERDNEESQEDRAIALEQGAKHFDSLLKLRRHIDRVEREDKFKKNLEYQAHNLIEKFPGLLDGETEVNGADLVEYLSSFAREKSK